MAAGIILAGIVGLISGILVNYLADVLPIRRQLVRPVCLNCEKPYPLTDYILNRRCKNCSKPASFRKYLVILIGIAAAIALWVFPPHKLGFWIGIILVDYLAVIAVIDLEFRLILQPVSLFGYVAGLAIGIWQHGLVSTIIGGAAGFAIMLLLYYLGGLFANGLARLRHTQNDEVALGFGDVMLSGVLGLILGWPGITAGLVLAILLGGLVSILIILGNLFKRSYQPFMAIPYAPFLILGAVILLYRP